MATSNITTDGPEVKPAPSTLYDVAAVFGASVQLPNFDKVKPETWFAVAEANFALRRVTHSTTKYYYVLSKLDATTLQKLSTFIKRPRGSDPFKEIRDMLCEAYEPPLEQKLDALLALMDISDERPREFGMELQRLASDASLDNVLKQIFILCLPRSIFTKISSSLHGKLESIIAAADRAWTAAAASYGSAPASVSVIFGPQASASRRGGRCGRQRGPRQAAGQTKTVMLCHFHLKFGDAARKCAPSCMRFNENCPRDNSAPQVFHVKEEPDGEDAQVDTASGCRARPDLPYLDLRSWDSSSTTFRVGDACSTSAHMLPSGPPPRQP